MLLPRPFLLLAPALLLLALFLLLPALLALLQGLTNLALLGPEAQALRFVGLANLVRALQDPFFWNALKISALYVLFSALLGQAGLGLALALLLRGLPPLLAQALRGAVLLAWITPSVAVALMWAAFLNPEGTLNGLLQALGQGPIAWLRERPLESVVAYNVWRGLGFSLLLFEAALRTVPAELLEAAAVDGARPFRRFLTVTLPLIRPHLLTDLILITLWTFNDFGPFLLTGGGPGYRTEVLPIYAYRVAFKHFELGYGAAIATLLLLVNLALALLYLRLGRSR